MPPRYDVFLSHSSADKPAVEEIAHKLREKGIELFLDKWHLVPGEPWQEALEKALKQSATCAVFLGSSGIGPWQDKEMRVVLDRQTRKQGPRVIPVLLPHARQPKEEELPPFLSLPTWVDFSSGLDDEEAFQRLVAGIRGQAPGPMEGVQSPLSNYRSMAIPPEGFVHRREYDRVMEALCSENPHGSTVGITTALRGAGGFGKTALAQAVCHNERVWRTYPDGILWTTMGEEVSESGRLSRLRDLIRWWTGAEPPVFETIDSASAFLRNLLGKSKVLLVIDDAWSDLDLIPFQGMCSALLITTREKDILSRSGERIDVDAMEIPEAVNLLRAGLPEWEIAIFKDLAQRLGEWPLLLTLVNRQLREMIEEDGFTIGEALRNVESTLQAEGLTAFDRENSQARQSAVEKTLAVSLRRLQDSEIARYRYLAVFPEDVEIPVSVLERLWGIPQSAAEKLCRRLDNLSLLLRFDLRRGVLQIHDVIRHYLVYREKENLPNLHRRFLEASLPQSGFWKDLAVEEFYLWRGLGYHLLEAGERGVLRNLLLDHSYLQAKLRATDVNMLVADYEYFVKDDEEIRLVQRAIWMSAHIIAKDHEQLAPHLLGRLLGGETDGLKSLLDQCKNVSRFRPRVPSFRPPGPLLRTIEVDHFCDALSVVDERHAISGSSIGTLKVWDLIVGKAIQDLEGHHGRIWAIAKIDSRYSVSASSDGTLRVWDLITGQSVIILEGHNDWVTAVAVVDRYIVSGSRAGEMRVWSLETGKCLRILEGHSDWITAVAVADSQRVVSSSEDGTLRVWNLETGKTQKVLEGHSEWVNTVAVVDGRHAVSGSSDKTLRIWDLETGQSLRTLTGYYGSVKTIAVIEGSWRAVSGSLDGILRVWDLKKGQALPIIEENDSGDAGVAAIDGQRFVSLSSNRKMQVWDLEARQTLRVLERHQASVRAVAVVDYQRVLSGSRDGTLRLWDLETGKTLRTLQGHNDWFTAVTTINSQLAISGSKNGVLKVWDLETGQTIKILKGHKDWITAVTVADSQYAISSSYDGTLRIWNLENGEILRILEGHEDWISAVAIVDNQCLISGSSDRTLRVWNLETGRLLRILEGDGDWVTAVAVKSHHAVSGSSKGALQVWDLETGQLLRSIDGHNGPSSCIGKTV